jgi:hypothetical protein
MTFAAVSKPISSESASGAQPAPSAIYVLDDLLALSAQDLATLYAEARCPRLGDVKGDLRGRLLALPALSGIAAALPRALASTSRFPWRGKSFSPRSDDRGDGINRVLLDRWKLYRFETFVAKSRAGDFDAVQLDYDNKDNPFFIRPIKDEIRELSPGVYLGQAYLQTKSKDHLVLYFGLTSKK